MTFEERKIAEFLDKFSYLEHPINYYLKESYVKNNKKGIEHIYDIKDFLSSTLSEYKEELISKMPKPLNHKCHCNEHSDIEEQIKCTPLLAESVGFNSCLNRIIKIIKES